MLKAHHRPGFSETIIGIALTDGTFQCECGYGRGRPMLTIDRMTCLTDQAYKSLILSQRTRVTASASFSPPHHVEPNSNKGMSPVVLKVPKNEK